MGLLICAGSIVAEGDFTRQRKVVLARVSSWFKVVLLDVYLGAIHPY